MRGSRLTTMDFKPGRPLFARRNKRKLRWILVPLVLTGAAMTAWALFDSPLVALGSSPESSSEGVETRLELPPAAPSNADQTRAVKPVTAPAAPTVSRIAPSQSSEASMLARHVITPNKPKPLSTPNSHTEVAEPAAAHEITAPLPEIARVIAREPAPAWKTLEVRSGDSLSALFSRAGLNANELHQIMNSGKEAAALKRIHPGDEIHYQMNGDKRLLAIRYRVSDDRTLITERQTAGFRSRIEKAPPDIAQREAQGVISSSLFLAGRQAGLEDRLTMELANIFGWDVDFALDIRSGDRFAIVYEALYRDGQFVRSGNILGAEFINRGKSYRAVRHVDSNGGITYYSPEGRSMRRAFLRSPVDFHRISSHFNPNRLHPVLGTNRPHRGVDYAAPTGTPIRASGDGRIVHLGVHGGYGHTIIIQHGSRYSTLYAHMSRYANNLKAGSRVRQGQVIGYVGMSGLATGPHLHYEFLVDGTHRDPVKVKFPDADPIASRYRANFSASAALMITKLNAMTPQQMALQD